MWRNGAAATILARSSIRRCDASLANPRIRNAPSANRSRDAAPSPNKLSIPQAARFIGRVYPVIPGGVRSLGAEPYLGGAMHAATGRTATGVLVPRRRITTYENECTAWYLGFGSWSRHCNQRRHGTRRGGSVVAGPRTATATTRAGLL